MSISVPVIVTLGGAGLLLGPLFGSFLYTLIDDFVTLHFINYHLAVLGFVIVAVIYFVPRGLIRQVDVLYRSLHKKKWRAI